jgi:hypothetical protein
MKIALVFCAECFSLLFSGRRVRWLLSLNRIIATSGHRRNRGEIIFAFRKNPVPKISLRAIFLGIRLALSTGKTRYEAALFIMSAVTGGQLAIKTARPLHLARRLMIFPNCEEKPSKKRPFDTL